MAPSAVASSTTRDSSAIPAALSTERGMVTCPFLPIFTSSMGSSRFSDYRNTGMPASRNTDAKPPRCPGYHVRMANSDAPPPVREIPATELKAMMDRGQVFELVDVRTPAERSIAAIAGSRLLDQETYDSLLTLDPEAAIVFDCHLGDRS